MSIGSKCVSRLKKGGLGVLDLSKFGSVLRLHWLWHSKESPFKPWVGTGTPYSDLFDATTKTILSNRESTIFWTDRRVDNCSLNRIAPQLFLIAKRKNRMVVDALNSNNWIKDTRDKITPIMLNEYMGL